jgi:LacI family transcriptional regulator
MSTIHDVARKAGVSSTTVSHVLNNTRFVSEELRNRVLESVNEVGYRPNILARSLRSGETKTIGLIVPDNSNPFFAEIARHIEDVGFERGYSLILCNSDNSQKKQSTYVDVLLSKRVDGIILISAGEKEDDLSGLFETGIPVVIADREIPEMFADIVLVDNEAGGYIATKYLIDLGHRRIACVTGPSKVSPSAHRVSGYKRALDEAGLMLDPALIVPGDFSLQSGEVALNELLALKQPPSAVFVCNDLMAIGAIRAAFDHGLRIPDDLSIIGFDDILLAPATFPALTTIAQPKLEIARTTTELLIQRMQEREAGERKRVLLTPQLVIRESCGVWHGDNQ